VPGKPTWRAQGISPALLGRWQRRALAQAVPSSAERAEIKRVEMERDMLKKVVTSNCFTRSISQPPQS